MLEQKFLQVDEARKGEIEANQFTEAILDIFKKAKDERKTKESNLVKMVQASYIA